MPLTGNPTYLAELDRARQLHIDKAAGYTGENPDSWANFREATNWGSSPLDGCFIRMGDKYKRAQAVYRNASHDRVGESLIDTLRDLAAYALIGVCLIIEEQEAEANARLEAKVEQVFDALTFEPEDAGIGVQTPPLPPLYGPSHRPAVALFSETYWHDEARTVCSRYETHSHLMSSSGTSAVIFP